METYIGIVAVVILAGVFVGMRGRRPCGLKLDMDMIRAEKDKDCPYKVEPHAK